MTDNQEPEYIITEKQIEMLRYGDIDRIKDNYIKKIHSRPYHPAPEPCMYQGLKDGKLLCAFLVPEPDLYVELTEAIRQSEREKVLDELGNKLYYEFHAHQRTLDGRDVVTGCKKVIESLRKVE
jgi:hypothetical protein